MAQERSAEFREKVAHERIQKINGLAWLMGLEFDRSQTNFAVLRKALELGLVSDWFLFNDRSLRVAPALTIGSADIKKAVGIIHRAIEAVGG
jgi:acetylornithine/succinyldiaminopimelate/putrescine aminotransferase